MVCVKRKVVYPQHIVRESNAFSGCSSADNHDRRAGRCPIAAGHTLLSPSTEPPSYLEAMTPGMLVTVIGTLGIAIICKNLTWPPEGIIKKLRTGGQFA